MPAWMEQAIPCSHSEFATTLTALRSTASEMLFPFAPFRTLQPEEATQVLAPLSGTILLDRQKLLSLGIPRCGLAETAWMLLFWKAAAAGWRSPGWPSAP